MKQVWVLNHYAQDPGSAGGTRHFHLAKYLSCYGWQATVIASSVEFSSGRQRLSPRESFRLDLQDGVPFLWVRTPKYEGNGIGRIINMLSYSFRVMSSHAIKMLPFPDVIVGSSVHPFAAAAAALLAQRFNVPFVFEVRDLWPQTLIDMGRLREDSLMTWMLRKLELWLYRRAARIIVLLPKASEYITLLGIPDDRIVWIPNGVDLTLFPSSSYSTQHAESNVFTLMYFGAHGSANGLHDVLIAMKLVQESPHGDRIRLRMIGDGLLKPALIEQAKKLKLCNVYFEEPVPKNKIPLLAEQADAFVIAVLDLPNLYRFGISMNKLFDYMAGSRPIIIASGIINNPIAESASGLTVPPGNPKALAEAILKLAAMSEDSRLVMGLSGRKYVEENHNFQHLSHRLASLLNQVCAEYK